MCVCQWPTYNSGKMEFELRKPTSAAAALEHYNLKARHLEENSNMPEKTSK